MRLEWYLGRLLAVVIVMIAASFGASMAQAHEGHPYHPPVPAASAAPVAAAPVQEDVKSAAAAPAAVKADSRPLGVAALVAQASPSSAKTALAVLTLSADDMGKTGGCNGHCCGKGKVCCHSALTPVSISAASPAPLAVMVRASQQAARPSLAPEALPKPPRPFA